MSDNYGFEEVDWEDDPQTFEEKKLSSSDSTPKPDDGMELKLGDIIEITSPTNAEYHQKTFFIEYIDEIKIKLIDVSTLEKRVLTLYDNGQLTDESINVIALLSRSEELGYARQNELVPKKWVDIHFGGEIPMIITGEITNLDEDMIEVTTYPDFDVIYINFEYKGMPENIPILQFHLRDKPASVSGSLVEMAEEEKIEAPSYDSASIKTNESGEMSVHIPENPKTDKNYNNILDELFEQSNIVFGEDVELEINVEVSKTERRFGLELQLKDLMDELLSTIPSNKRTPLVIDRVNTVVRRFKELRQFFSEFDENGNVVRHRNITADYKPLAETLAKMDTNIRWILPVVKNKTKLFSTFEDDSIQNMTNLSDLQSYNSKKNVSNNQKRYSTFYSNINDDFTPFSEPESTHDVLTDENFRVSADIETVVDNLGRYESYRSFSPEGFKLSKKGWMLEYMPVSKSRFVIQKYNLGLSKLGEHVMKSGKRIFIREPMTQNDKIAVKSVILLPHQAVEFSRVDLPNTNIMNKTYLSHNWLYHFKLLNKKMSFQTKMIEDLDEDVFYETESAKNFVDFVKNKRIKFLDSAIDYDISQKLLKDDNIDYRSFLNAVIPNTRILIQMLRGRATAYNFMEMIQYFEPFRLSADNITYSGRTKGETNDFASGRGGPYQEIRTYIKELMMAYKTALDENRKKYDAMAFKKYDDSGRFQLNNVYKIFAFNDEYLKLVATRYKFDNEDTYKSQNVYKSSSELLNSLLIKDNGYAYAAMVSLMMAPLYTPNLSSMISIADDGVIKSTSKKCVTQVIAKKYTSIRDLQKDNDIGEDIYFDKEYDSTPYPLLTKYTEDRKKMLADDFAPYLRANLMDKHDANPATVDDLVKALIAGKKKVSDGNYAILVEYPKLEKTISEEDLTPKEKRSVDIEADAKKKVSYYVRKRGNWTRVDESEGLNNELLCYSKDQCVVDKKECLSKEDSFNHMKKIAQKHAMKEYDQATIEKTMEDIGADMKARALYYVDLLKKKIWLADSRVEQYDFYAKNLSKFAIKLDFVVSPYETLRDLILEQSDFAKKQNDILVFRERFCRDAVINEYSKEMQYWLYCVDTDTKLLPRFIYELAQKYSIGADYNYEMDVLCSRIGRLSDDGEAIVDKNTGYKIKSVDFMAMDEYNDAGFKIVSHEIMGQSAGEALRDAINDEISEMSYTTTTSGKAFKMFENELTQEVYNIASALCGYMHITIEPIEGVILSNAIRIIKANLYSPEKYKKIEEMNAKKNVTIPSYPTYKNQNILFFSAATTFVAIQTMIPSFKPSKTFPGCVFSFGGYPLDGGVEYTTGLKYLSCVIQKIVGNVEPWNSIKHLKRDGIMKRLVEYVGKILKEPDIEELYVKKKTHLILFPDNDVPEILNVGKWRTFQPPIVPFSIVKSLKTVSEEFKDELAISLKSGHKNQHKQLGVIYNKIIQHSYAVVESVNKVVEEGKEALLKAGTIIFLENACCEEKEQKTAIQFFINKNANIQKYLDFIRKNGTIMEEIKMMSRAPYISPGTKALSLLSTSKIISEENIYSAFIHYCKLLNKQSLVPDDMRIFFQEKPGGMQPQWDLKQTIDHLKKLGKKFDIDSLKQLMQIIARRNTIHGINTSPIDIQYTRGFSDLIERLNASQTPVIEAKLVDYLKIILEKFDINRPIDKDMVTMSKMKKHLARVNREMSTQIMEYINEFGTTRTLAEKRKIKTFLDNLTVWNCDRDMLKTKSYNDEGQYKVIQYIRNSVFMITKTVPAIIANERHEKRTEYLQFSAKHWDLSLKHFYVIQAHVNKYFEKIHSYVKDDLVCRFFKDINMKMVDLNLFLSYIPAFTSFINEDKLYYLLFDKEALYLLHAYCYYSVLYELVTGSDTDEYLKLDMEEVKNKRKNMKASDEQEGEGDEDDYEDLGEYPEEVDISSGNRMDFRQRVCDLLIIMIEMDMLNKKTVDKPYEDLSDKAYNESKREKATITDYLKNMTIEERRVENILKNYKMGRWNLGEQKGVYEYDKSLYDVEKSELYGVREDQPEEVNTEHNDYDPDAEAEREAEQEEFNIDDLDEDFMDGVYYQEDRDAE
jgi:hypothetical protein